ncbi:MAG TPA: hypothetical protein VLZ29_03950, partial [Sulfurimonas sp.]
ESLEAILGQKEDLQDSISDLYIDGLSPMEYNNIITKEMNQLSQEITSLAKKLNLDIDSLDSSKNEQYKESLKNSIQEIRSEMQLKREKHAKLLSKMVGKDDLLLYNNTKKEIDALTRQEKREEMILKQNEEAFISITNSLIKALTSKMILLDK